MQDQRGNLDESHVPGQRHPSDDGDWAGDSTRAGDGHADDGHADDTVVGTAHVDHETGVIHDSDLHDGDRHDGDVPEGGTYASGSALADTDHDGVADRDDVEVVDHDQALAEEQAEDRVEDRVEDRADERAEEHEAREENEARGDADFVPADVDPRVDERDEIEAAAAEDAEDRAWAAEHTDDANADDTRVDEAYADDTRVDEAYAADAARTDDDAARTDDEAVRSDDDADVDVADDTDADTDAERRDDDPFAEPVATSEALEGGEALDAGDVVAVPVPDAHDSTDDRADGAAGQDLLPGAVPTVPVGAIWAEGAVDGLRERWRELQLRFIDDPRSVAGEADQLVAEAVSTITGALESQRERLSAWQSEGGEDTERLRAAVRQYRDFLDRLLGL